MSPHEERLVLELHSKWGNRWSRIARKLPGRTDNEIKNYWRTHMRKKAQEWKKATSHSPPSSSVSSSSSTEFSNCSSTVSNGNSPTVESVPIAEIKERSFYDTGGFDAPAAPPPPAAAAAAAAKGNKAAAAAPAEEEKSQKVYYMDEIWKDMEFFGDEAINPVCDGGCCDFSCQIVVASPAWDYCPVSLWVMDDEEEGSKMFPNPPPVSDPFYYSFCNQESAAITG